MGWHTRMLIARAAQDDEFHFKQGKEKMGRAATLRPLAWGTVEGGVGTDFVAGAASATSREYDLPVTAAVASPLRALGIDLTLRVEFAPPIGLTVTVPVRGAGSTGAASTYQDAVAAACRVLKRGLLDDPSAWRCLAFDPQQRDELQKTLRYVGVGAEDIAVSEGIAEEILRSHSTVVQIQGDDGQSETVKEVLCLPVAVSLEHTPTA